MYIRSIVGILKFFWGQTRVKNVVIASPFQRVNFSFISSLARGYKVQKLIFFFPFLVFFFKGAWVARERDRERDIKERGSVQ